MLKARTVVHVGALALALGLAGCSTMSDVGDGIASIDPTGLLGGSDDNATPDLADVPAAPGNASTPDQQTQVASDVNAAGNQAQYSADALRAGTEAAAPPPTPAEATPSLAQQALAAPAPVAAPAATPSTAPSAAMADAAPSAVPMADDAPPSTDAAPSAAPSAEPVREPAPVRTASAEPAVPAVAPGTAAAAAAPTASAATPVGPSMTASATPSGAEPAVPASTPVRGGGIMAAPVMSDAQLGFRPSAAPPLNSSMNQWVSPAILNHYRQTAALTTVSNPDAAVPATGGQMNAASAAGGIPPTATVLFAGDGTTLSASGRSQIRTAVAAFKAQGSSGTLRVVGHASSRTANMPVEKHLELIFAKSQARANAVAQELIHDGVPAAQVIVEAVGDSQPIYYESMPKGEDGNRRAEIFLQ